MRRAARVDLNQAEVVKAIRSIGAVVTPLHMVGRGVADLLVSYRQRWFLMEVKNGRLPPSERELTPDEKKWIYAQRAPVFIVNSSMEAIDLLRRVP